MFNLIEEAWIPVIRKDGERSTIAPWELTSDYQENPIVELDAPRPDFNGALVQFLIGIVQTELPPTNPVTWKRMFRRPPGPEELKASFGTHIDAFNLDGDGPRFMQDLTLAKGEALAIDKLLIERPGEQTVKKNIDHFLKRGGIDHLCMTCAAMALFTLQTNAPSGGRGHRTSLRGGGPLTTLVTGRTLWETVWLNVISPQELERYGNSALTGAADIFPWMGETRTSKDDEITTPQDVNPAQMFWGMPRRIRLDLDGESEPGACDLCGTTTERLVSAFSAKDSGVNYKGGWCHVLSPYSTNPKGELLAKHAQPGGVTYRNWLGLVQNDSQNNSRPAAVVSLFREERQAGLTGFQPHLWAFGYDMDNMKARCWYEGKMPLHHIDEGLLPAYEEEIARLVRTAGLIGFSVRTSIKKALFSRPEDATGDLSFIDARFWQDTEPAFHKTLDELAILLKEGGDRTALKLNWLKSLRKEGERLFDDYSQADLIDQTDPKRVALAWRDLRRFTSKSNKKVRETLDLPIEAKPDKADTPGAGA